MMPRLANAVRPAAGAATVNQPVDGADRNVAVLRAAGCSASAADDLLRRDACELGFGVASGGC